MTMPGMSADLVPVPGELAVLDGIDIADLTSNEAELITSRVRQWVNSFPAEDVARAYHGRIWVALAYSSWAEWCECELGGLKLPTPKRREAVAELAETGMSNRAIADVIGASEPTVRRDRGASFDAPDEITGQDGKTYPRPQPKPVVPQPNAAPAKPRRNPLPRQFEDALYDLTRVTTRIAKLAADDRFKEHRQALGSHRASDVTRAIQALIPVLAQLRPDQIKVIIAELNQL